ncbi:MAG TPA: Uma2 family endonuclease [Actinomycetota bacterium]
MNAPLYARAGIPEIWIVDLNRRLVEVCRSPAGEDYREREEAGPDGELGPAALPEVRFPASEILRA